MTIAFRRFLHLNTEMLHDYMSSLDPGQLASIIKTQRTDTKPSETGQNALGEAPETVDGASEERTTRQNVKWSDRHSFNKLHGAMEDQISAYEEEEGIDITKLRKRRFVEVTRDFSLSPVNEMLESMMSLAQMARSFGQLNSDDDAQAEQTIQMMAMFFRGGDDADPSVPMVAEKDNSGTSVLFVAQRRHVTVNPDDFEGEMTVLGGVKTIIKSGEQKSMLDLFSNVPRAMRRSKTLDFEKMMTDMLSTLPDEVGGPIDPARLRVVGPAIVLDPLAVFHAGA